MFKCMKKALERSTPGIKHKLYLNKAVVYKEEPGISLSVHPWGTDLRPWTLGRGGKRLRFEGVAGRESDLICSVPIVESKERDFPGGPGAKTPSSQCRGQGSILSQGMDLACCNKDRRSFVPRLRSSAAKLIT